MANTKSAEKRNRQNEQRRQRNRAAMSEMRTEIKRVRAAVEQGTREAAEQALPQALRVIDVTARKKVIHPNRAARAKSRLTRAVQKLAAE